MYFIILSNNLCQVIRITVKKYTKRTGFYIFNEQLYQIVKSGNQTSHINSCDLLAIVYNTYVKHSDSFLVSEKVHKARKSHPPENNFPAANSNKSSSIKTGQISYLLTPMKVSSEDMATKVVKLFITAVLVMR